MKLHGARAREGGKARTVLLVILGVVLVLGIGGYLLFDFGMDVIAEQVGNDLRDNPVIRRHVGEIQTLELDFTATSAAPGKDTFVFKLTGSKANAELTADLVTTEEDVEKVTAGSIRLADGATYDLFEE